MPDISVALSTIASGILLGGMLALAALGLSIVLGVMRLVNLAHGDFLVVGAYAGLFFLKFAGVDPLLGLPVIAPSSRCLRSRSTASSSLRSLNVGPRRR